MQGVTSAQQVLEAEVTIQKAKEADVTVQGFPWTVSKGHMSGRGDLQAALPSTKQLEVGEMAPCCSEPGHTRDLGFD